MFNVEARFHYWLYVCFTNATDWGVNIYPLSQNHFQADIL